MKNGDKLIPNKEQKQAVEYDGGPLLIVAGAGTGKTLVIAEKMRYLIQKKKVKPEEILALTFTEKAANQMEERVDKILPYGYFQMWISTFHSFCDQVLRAEISHIGLSPSYKLLNNAESVIFLRNNLFLFNLKYFRPLGNPNKFLEGLLQHFSRLKDEDISPEEYFVWARKSFDSAQDKQETNEDEEEREKNLELAHAYELYQKLKIKEGYFDFSDLIYYSLLLFRKRGNILKKYQEKFKYILVDEFQDTNIAQYDLVKLLCPAKSNPRLTVVGDDSQAIYKFRGASVSNILNFMKDYKNARQVTLKTNYRSYQDLLDLSYRLIKHNDPDTLEAQLGISKKLEADKKGRGSYDFYFADTVEEEADHVAAEILKLKNTYKFADFAILTRANNHADPFIRALSQRGIPYQFLGPGVLFKQPEVKDLVAYLNFLADVDDSVSFYRVINMDIFDIDKRDIARLLSFARRTARPLFQAIEIFLGLNDKELYKAEFEIYRAYSPLLEKSSKEKLKVIYSMTLRHLKMVKKDTAGQILYYFLADTGYLNQLVSYKTSQEEKIGLNISKFFSRLKAYESEHEDASVFAVVDFIKMSMELGESPRADQDYVNEYDAVNILTVHSAKGLEWPVVFLINLSRGRFPTYERREQIPIPQELIKETLPKSDHHLLEERRLFYVAATRAMDKLYLSSSKFYTDGKRERKPSQFIFESLGEDWIEKKLIKKSDEKAQLSIFDFKKDEEVIIKKEIPVNVFSYSQLETYILCPLRYKYQYVLRVPTTSGSAASFGDTIHRTLQKFYQEFLSDKTVSFPRLLKLYKESWIPIGFASPAHEARMKKEGVHMLDVYYKTFHNKNLKVLDLEKAFKIRVGRDILISGKMDRVDLPAGRQGKNDGEIEIIDYKTGRRPTDRELKDNLQLSIYLMAAADRGLYHKEIDRVTLTFYYLQGPEKISMKKTAGDIEKVQQKIASTVEEIRLNKFPANVGPHCDFCPFRMVCEAWQ